MQFGLQLDLRGMGVERLDAAEFLAFAAANSSAPSMSMPELRRRRARSWSIGRLMEYEVVGCDKDRSTGSWNGVAEVERVGEAVFERPRSQTRGTSA